MSEKSLQSEAMIRVTDPRSAKGAGWEMPNFEMPKLETPAAYCEFANSRLEQAKEVYDKANAVAEQTTVFFEKTCAVSADIAREYRAELIEAMSANINAAFDFGSELAGAKSIPEIVERSTAHARKQANFGPRSKARSRDCGTCDDGYGERAPKKATNLEGLVKKRPCTELRV